MEPNEHDHQLRYRGPALEGDSWSTANRRKRGVLETVAVELEGVLKEREIRKIVSIEVKGNAGSIGKNKGLCGASG